MTTLGSELYPIGCIAGVQPPTDKTEFATQHYTAAQGIRFVNGLPQKIKGWRGFVFSGGETMTGTARSMFSALLNTVSPQSVIGTNTRLYSLAGSSLVNITPVLTATTTIANSLDTDYGTLANDPITTAVGTGTLIIADTNAGLYRAGDYVTLSGATSVGGISNTLINAEHLIRSVGVNLYTITVAGTASSTATGGGASVVRATGLLNVNATAHTMADGDRTKITGAANTGGILAADINQEFIIRNVSTDDFQVMTDGTATSAVAAGGGVSTAYQLPLPEGEVDESFGQGYGMGKYGTGLYGIAKVSVNGRRYPRIWFFSRFGTRIIMTPGNQGALYEWNGSTAAAPVQISGAPTQVNYAFVSNNIVVTLGAGGTANKIKTSDQNDRTQWTASSTNQVFEDDIEGAGRLWSHVPVNGGNLLFTDIQTYLFSYIGLPLIWKIDLLEENIGLIAPMARVSIKGVAYWMGQGNFYRYSGGNVEIIPANTQLQSTILNYVYQNLNFSQKSKIFAWYNNMYDEIWWHIPPANALEPERIARLSLQDMSWVPDEMDRTCAEYPNNPYGNPRLIDTNLLYIHETGVNADTSPLPFTLTSNLMSLGKNTINFDAFIPDSIQTGDISFTMDAYLYPQSSGKSFNGSFTVAADSGRIPAQGNGRYYQSTWSGSALNNDWQMGVWNVYAQKGSPN